MAPKDTAILLQNSDNVDATVALGHLTTCLIDKVEGKEDAAGMPDM